MLGYPKKPVAAFLIGVAGIAVFSNVGAVEDKSSSHVMRILPVGNREPFRQEIRDGVRHEVDPSEGSLPPAEIRASLASENGEVPAESSVRLRLGEVSEPLRFPMPESGKIRLREGGNEAWLEPAISPAGKTLVIVWKTGAKWNEASCLSLDDSHRAIPAGACRVINVSQLEIGVVFGKTRYRLLPGKSAVLSMAPEVSSATMEILYAAPETTPKPLIRTIVPRDLSLRRQWVVHRSDQEGARQPVGIVSISEPLQQPPPARDQAVTPGNQP